MLFEFVDVSSPPLSESERDRYQKVVKHVLDMLRPAAEQWSVTVVAKSAMTRLDFTRDTDAARSLTVATDGDDDEHSQMFQSVCKFVWPYWPRDDKQQPS